MRCLKCGNDSRVRVHDRERRNRIEFIVTFDDRRERCRFIGVNKLKGISVVIKNRRRSEGR